MYNELLAFTTVPIIQGFYIIVNPIINVFSGMIYVKCKKQVENAKNLEKRLLKDLNGENAGKFKDGQNVKYAGTITSIKKKYTKRNIIQYKKQIIFRCFFFLF